MRKLKIALTVLSLTLMGACSVQSKNNSAQINGEWQVVELYGQPIPECLNTPTLTLNDSTSLFGGATGANEMTGHYQIKHDTITFLEGGVTLMMADSVSMEVENNYLQAIGQTRTFAVEGDDLMMKDPEGNTIITLKKK